MRQAWICTRCNSMYVSPIKVKGVLCEKCTGKVGGREVWMAPSNSECMIETGEDNGKFV